VTEIPRAVLSEHFQERMKGRRLRAAVFLTYQFDPGFFEQEILPVFVDLPLSHATAIRLAQLEEALAKVVCPIAVYYDANGLVAGDGGSAKLALGRIPVRHRTGLFHPKNVLLLVEAEHTAEGQPLQALIVASLSANLTRTGWWENVEGCHVEEIEEGDKTRLRDDLLSFLEGIRRRTAAGGDHQALREIMVFLRKVSSRLQKSTSGQLHTHFYGGPEPLADFLERTAGHLIRGAYLEVISPYFDDASSCKPLQELVDRFQPRRVLVFLPRSASGQAQCRSELYEAVRALPEVGWGRLPKEVTRLGRSADAGERLVHAKLYRFFRQNPKREIVFVGSANLTSAAHQAGGNLETGFLVDIIPPRRPNFWLSEDDRRPREFKARTEDEASQACGGTRVSLRYHWDRSTAEVFWDAPGESPALRIEARGIDLGLVPPLPARVWTPLAEDVTRRVAENLVETSLFRVHGETPAPGLLLVQEEGMSHKPSLLLRLTVADILRYWSLLTPEQRAAFLEARAPEVALMGQGADLVNRARAALDAETLFDRFAGFFHAFASLDRAVRAALDAGQETPATYRLFGRKYDSLLSLLDRVASEASGDDIDRYVIVLCARQLCNEIGRDYREYWSAHATDAAALEQRFRELGSIRQRLIETAPSELPPFLDWFDRHFLRRAAPAPEVEA